MPEISKKIAENGQLSLVERAGLFAEQVRAKVRYALGSREFKDNLRAMQREYGIDRMANVTYIGSGNDLSVQRAFPNTLNVDMIRPESIPEGFNFVQNDGEHLPGEDASVDLAVFKNSLAFLSTSKDLKRVLKPKGKVLFCGDIRQTDFSQAPKTIYEIGFQHLSLEHFIAWSDDGFKIVKQLSGDTFLLEQSTDTSAESERFRTIFNRNRDIFYRLVAENPDDLSMDEIQHCLMMHVGPLKDMKWEFFEEALDIAREEAPPKAYAAIESVIKDFYEKNRAQDK